MAHQSVSRNYIPQAVAWMALVSSLGGCTQKASEPRTDSEDNRRIVSQFVRIFYDERDVRRAFEGYVVPDYVQHNPNIRDGREAAIQALTPLFSNPSVHLEVRHVLVDGDMAVVHLFARSAPDARGAAVADIFRLSHGKIVEHWDIIEDIPEKTANPHPMF